MLIPIASFKTMEIVVSAKFNCCADVACPAVIIRFPHMFHLAADICTCECKVLASLPFMILQTHRGAVLVISILASFSTIRKNNLPIKSYIALQ